MQSVVSALEFIPDLPDAVDEFVRIFAPSRIMVVVTPAHSPLADDGFRLLTGRKASGKRSETAKAFESIRSPRSPECRQDQLLVGTSSGSQLASS
jgi:hypothetical protein